ncbi:ubiquitin carboxyl-terminal hydrolase 36-like isoform X2 [Thrips palmi]|nr:ubiquitin carboxyl-terminal hydrolase 36-like isoform X2 [Thrips palmi]
MKLIEKSGLVLQQSLVPNHVRADLPHPQTVLYSPDKISMIWGTGGTGVGLKNGGNTCYLNSVLQVLFHIPAVVQMLEEELQPHCLCTLCLLCVIRSQLQNSGSTVEPHGLIDQIDNIFGRAVKGKQEDPHEFLRRLGEKIEIDFLQHRGLRSSDLDQASAETTAWHQIFGGYMKYTVTCSKCKSDSETVQHFQDLRVPVVQFKTLQGAVNSLFKAEILEDYMCSCNNKKKRTCKQTISIEKAPIVLTIQLKRFDNEGNKVLTEVSIPKQLELHSKFPYRLSGIVHHLGENINTGHYKAVVKCSTLGFFSFDDQNVERVTWKSASTVPSPYLIFYILDQK